MRRLWALLVPLRPFGLFLERPLELQPPPLHPNCRCVVIPIGSRL